MKYRLILAAAASLAALAVTHSATSAPSAPETRRAFFGDLHLHTGYSFDAYALMGARTEPETAYLFAKGRPVDYLGASVRRSRPLDFFAVTDHSEYLGSFRQLVDPASALSRTELGAMMKADPVRAAMGGMLRLMTPEASSAMKAAMGSAWDHLVDTAERHYQPGRFTTFIAYEWTVMGKGGSNLHRNVIFRGKGPAAPFSAMDSVRPEDLWAFLDGQRAKGIEGLAIPHNSNASDGLMFDWNMSNGRPIDQAYAQSRALNEPLAEIYQHKGQSETAPAISGADEFAEFERADTLLGSGGKSKPDGSYVRQALGRGLVVQDRVGTNPFKMGFVAAGDFHNGLTDSAESAYAGVSLFSTDPKANLPDLEFARRILSQPVGADASKAVASVDRAKMDVARAPGQLNWSSGGLTGVWAEENTREAIYAALRRKETFATSGTQMRLRVFGGWKLPANLQRRPDWVRLAYRMGTPMGGDLAPPPARRAAPSFVFEAAKDPEGANLDRIQVVKLWLDGTTYREKIVDVAWSAERRRDPRTGKLPAVRNTVDTKTATYSNAIGAATLKGQWRDPEFDAAKSAVYYARVLEVPTPRWPTLLAAARGLPLPQGMPATLQERAISSPIWYTPAQRRN
jgi:Protein of unknown function (DUF3604)